MMIQPLDPPDGAEPDRAGEYERMRRAILAMDSFEEAPIDMSLHVRIFRHPFEPTAWPDTCGHPEPDGWFCGSSRAEHER